MVPLSTALTSVTNMSEKCKSTSPSKKSETIGIEEKLGVISQLEKGEQIVDLCGTVRFIHSSVRTFCDKSHRITESVKSETKVLKCLCSKTSAVLSEWPIPETMNVSLLHFYCLRNK